MTDVQDVKNILISYEDECKKINNNQLKANMEKELSEIFAAWFPYTRKFELTESDIKVIESAPWKRYKTLEEYVNSKNNKKSNKTCSRCGSIMRETVNNYVCSNEECSCIETITSKTDIKPVAKVQIERNMNEFDDLLLNIEGRLNLPNNKFTVEILEELKQEAIILLEKYNIIKSDKITEKPSDKYTEEFLQQAFKFLEISDIKTIFTIVTERHDSVGVKKRGEKLELKKCYSYCFSAKCYLTKSYPEVRISANNDDKLLLQKIYLLMLTKFEERKQQTGINENFPYQPSVIKNIIYKNKILSAKYNILFENFSSKKPGTENKITNKCDELLRMLSEDDLEKLKIEL